METENCCTFQQLSEPTENKVIETCPLFSKFVPSPYLGWIRFYSPALKKRGLYWIWVVRHSVIFFFLYLLNIWSTYGQNSIQFCICIDTDKTYLVVVTFHFSQICTRVMVLDLPKNFVSAQYLEYELTEFDHILYMHLY